MYIENINLWLSNADKTAEFGGKLTNSLYEEPLTILLRGEIGTGKTTLLRGVAQGLGIHGPLTSPTFALEQRYELENRREFLHIDLYRLDEAQARSLLASNEEFHGIRCIEWPENAGNVTWSGPVIDIGLREEGDGRRAEISFGDIALPSMDDVEAWRAEVLLQPHIVAHCEAVAWVCDQLSDLLIARGVPVRKLALHRSAQLHDLLRFLDFSDKVRPLNADVSEAQQRTWDTVKARYPLTHEKGCAAFLRDRGFGALAAIVETHGLTTDFPRRPTIEQTLLYYADKRVALERIVTMEERFDDFIRRYGGDPSDPHFLAWMESSRAVERSLFPEGPPTLGEA